MLIFDKATRMVTGQLPVKRIFHAFRPTAQFSAKKAVPVPTDISALPLWCPGTVDALPKLTITFPPVGEFRIRRIISRSAPRPTTKYPSVKLNRSVHCESVLEAEVAELFDACAGITSFGEQPAKLTYECAGVIHDHVPDFLVQAGNRRAFVEVKFASTITAADLNRTRLLQRALQPLGYEYYLVTEVEIGRSHFQDNAKYLLRRARTPASESTRAHLYSRARSSRLCLGDVVDTPELPDVASMIVAGILSVSMSDRFGPATIISVTPAQEGTPWAWELFQ